MAVFRGDGVAMRHRVITAYTVRKGQGGAQALRSGIGVPRPRYKDLEKVFRESLVAEIRNYREEEAELDSE
eukprot:jgi/Pico_ML_1/51713/g281.t1